MANIHSLRDLERQQYQPQRNNVDPANAERGISMMQGPYSGHIPTISERFLPRLTWRTATAVMSVIQVLMFIITLIVGGAKFDGAFVKGNEMAGPSSRTLRYMGGKFTPDIRDDYELWRLVTPIFLHAGILHLASNMFFQLRFGPTMEARWGIGRFLALYFITGIGASFWSAVLSPGSVSVGASGALFGVLGANIAYLAYNWAEIPHRGMEAFMMVFVVVINMLLGMSGNVDNSAHGGGLLTGLVAGLCIPPTLVYRKQENIIRGVGAFLTFGMFLLFILLLWVGHPQ